MKGKEATVVEPGIRSGTKRLKPRWAAQTLGKVVLSGLHWYALVTKPGAEQPVAAQLERRGLVTVVPVRLEERQVNRFARRKHMVEYPLLPRYVFVGFGYGVVSDYDGEVREFFALQRDLTLVQGVVGMEGMPRRMDAIKVAEFIRRSGVVIKMLPVPVDRTPKAGDDALILSGPFEGNVVRVHEIKGMEARVMMPFFGDKTMVVSTGLANLSKAD